MTTMQDSQTTPEAGPNMVQLGQPIAVQPYLWKGMIEKFLKGQPKVLGVVQVLISLMILSLGIILMSVTVPGYYYAHPSTFLVHTGYTVWGPVMFIFSGSLSIAAGIKTTRGLVRGSLGLNITSSVFAAVGLILTSISLSINSMGPFYCGYRIRSEDCSMIIPIFLKAVQHLQIFLGLSLFCLRLSLVRILDIIQDNNPGESHYLKGMEAMVLILTLLEFCIAVSLSSFGSKVMCYNSGQVLYILPSNPHMAEAAPSAAFSTELMPPKYQEKNDPENLS